MNPLARVPRWLWLSLAVLIAIRTGLPIALEMAIPWIAKRETGADVEIKNVDIGVFGGKLVFEGLRVASPDPSEASDDARLPEEPQSSEALTAWAILAKALAVVL